MEVDDAAVAGVSGGGDAGQLRPAAIELGGRLRERRDTPEIGTDQRELPAQFGASVEGACGVVLDALHEGDRCFKLGGADLPGIGPGPKQCPLDHTYPFSSQPQLTQAILLTHGLSFYSGSLKASATIFLLMAAESTW